MKLSQLFTGDVHIEESGRTAQNPSARSAADINRQIHSLVPGQTIRGEIVSRNGSEVQIRLSEDMVLNARVDQSIYLELGKNVTFEVRNSGSTLSLSPLFTNVAADVNVLKALDMAGLPVNEVTVSMTGQLMEAGLPVNKASLQQIYREINSFPGNEISDVVNLHRFQMPVNDANMQQMASYRNLTYQLIRGLTDVLDVLPAAVNGMLEQGDIQGALGVFRELLSMAGEGMTSETGVLAESMLGQAESAEGIVAENPPEPELLFSRGLSGPEEDAPGGILPRENLSGEAAEGAAPESAGENTPVAADGKGGLLSPESRGILADSLLQVLDELSLPSAESASWGEQIQQFGRGELPEAELFSMAQRLLDKAADTGRAAEVLQKLLSDGEFQTALGEQLKCQWTLEPSEVSQPGRVEEFYRRLDRQLKGLMQSLETGGQGGSAAYRAAVNVSQNVDFLNQLNQMYTYVQLPLRLQHSDAHGDLYVYTNKRSFGDSDGKVSALLHLDMERLGPVDVYVTLQESKVSTKFYVADDEILDFIEEHMELLTDRLQKRGYDCSCSTTVRQTGKEESAGGLEPILGQEKGILLSQYAFDVRT